MIHVKRDVSNRPRGFQGRAQEWRRAFLRARALDGSLTATKFWQKVRPQIKSDADALARVFYGKCAYCESRMAHVQHPQIEHYRPKGRPEFETQLFVWENWLLSCGRCNDSKWQHFPACDGGTPCLLDPTVDTPSAHIAFAREHVAGTTKRGTETVKLLGLDRGPLEDARAHWLIYVDALLLLAVRPSQLREARDLLVWCIHEEAPWSGCVREYIATKAPKLLQAPQVVVGANPVLRIKELVEERREDVALLA